MAGTPAVGLQRVGAVPTTAASSCSSAAPSERVRRPSADFQFKFANTLRMTGR